jgi:chemotaxis protein methyltransferase CheR
MSDSALSTGLLTCREFHQFRNLAHQEFGLDLPEGKEQLVASRLRKKMRELNLDSFQAYYRHIVDDRTGVALTAMIDALTTNHTSFFREPAHFDFLRQVVLPGLRFRSLIEIWSAACSTGEEPYSIAFCLLDELGIDRSSRLRILATDISTRVLDAARNAVYPAERFQGIPPEQLRPYLLRGEGKQKDRYLVKRQVRAAIEFRRANLMEKISQFGEFSVIFCRNVMIYFDRSTQQDLVKRLGGCLEPGGYLFIGHAESLGGIEHALEYVRPAVYRKPDNAGSRTVASGGRK